MKNTLPAFAFVYSGCWQSVRVGMCVGSGVAPRRGGCARNSFHARSAIEGGAIKHNVSSVCDVKNGHTPQFAMKHGFFVFKAEGRKLF